MILLGNFDLLSVGIAVAATVVLGFSVYFSDKTSLTNKYFLLFTLITAFWGLVNYLNYQTQNYTQALWTIRLVMFSATWQAYTLFLLLYVLPKEQINIKFLFRWPLLLVVIFTSLLTLTPFVFSDIALAPPGQVSQPISNWGVVIFAVVAVSLVISGIFLLIRKAIISTGNDRKPLKLILFGASLMFALIIIFNLIAVVIFNTTRFIPFGALFVFPFIACTSYAILRQKLFSVRAMWTGVLVFLIAVTDFFEVIFAGEFGLILYRGAIFLLLLFFGILLIKGITRETKQREEIQELADRLKNVNSILAHDIKNVLGKNRDMFVETLDGTFGEITDQGKSFMKRLCRDTWDLITSVTNILKSRDQLKPNPQPFDFKQAVLGATASIKDKADEGKIKIETQIDEKENFIVNADSSLVVPHVLKNLLENAVNYSVVNGSIWINLLKKDQKTILLTIKDNGWGMTEDDKKILFSPGGHGPDSIKKNVHTSGYGLFIAKQTLDVHNGKIYGISEGRDKGSTFFVELPVDFTPAVSEAPKA